MRRWLFSLILIGLLGWLFIAIGQAAVNATPAETITPAPAQNPAASPTVTPVPVVTSATDRLAAPPTVENPNQADQGAQLFWLHCQPCHGDVGQGLTEDWRAQYPEEDQNCWTSGCHGKRPYEDGFTLPTTVPAVIGEESLERFETVGQLYGFISAAMPYQDPGYLTEEEYLAMTAFIARAHGAWDGTPLTAENTSNFRLRPSSATATPEPAATPAAATAEQPGSEDENGAGSFNTIVVGVAAGVFGSLIIVAILLRRRA